MSPSDLSQYGLGPVTSSTGQIPTSAGTYSPTNAPASRLNPFIDPTPWGRVSIGGVDLGLVRSIDGHSKPEDWNVQKGTSSSGATTVWKGTKLAEEITIEIELFNAAAIEKYYDARDALRPKLGKKPPSLPISNAAVNFSGITRIACKDVLPPKWQPSGGYWAGSIKVIEYNPSKTTNAGPASAAKQTKDSTPSANDQAAAELDKAMKQAAAL